MLKSWCTICSSLLIMVLLSTTYYETFAQVKPVTKVLFADPILDKNTGLYDLNITWSNSDPNIVPEYYVLEFFDRNFSSVSRSLNFPHSSAQGGPSKFSGFFDLDVPEGEYVFILLPRKTNTFMDTNGQYIINIGKESQHKRAEFLSVSEITTPVGNLMHKVEFRISTNNGMSWAKNLPVGWKIHHWHNDYNFDKVVSDYVFNDRTGELFIRFKNEGNFLHWWFCVLDENGKRVSQELHHVVITVFGEKPEMHTIQGKVTDQQSQQTIANAIVTAANISDNNNWLPYTTMSDSDGNYRLDVPKGDYILNGKFLRNSMMSPCYVEQYYRNTTDRTQATVLKVDADKQGIDFLLKPCSQESNRIAGIVTDSKNIPIPSSVVAFRLPDSNEGLNSMFVRTITTQNGSFLCEQLKPGNYLVFAFPSAVAAIPGFYKANEFATLEWQKATLINVTSNSTSQIVIKLRDLRSMMGKGGIKGWVRKNGGSMKHDNVQGAEPIQGAIAYAIDENGEVRGYALTNEEGMFSMTTLNKGKYTLRIERVGYESSVTEEIIAEETTIKEVTKSLSPAITSDITEENVKSEILVKPNPSGMITTIEFPMDKAQECTITISDIMGNKVLTETVRSIVGLNTHIVNTHTLPSGQYHIRIESEAGIRSVPLTIVR